MNVLEVNHLCKSFGGVQASQDISIRVADKQIVSIIGPNGAGKTTLFNLISGISKPDSGEIIINGKNIAGLALHEVAGMGISRTFQNIRLFKGLSVLENVMTSRDPRAKYNVFDAMLSTPRKKRIDQENRQQCIKYLELVGLAHQKDEKPENLPYGMQRKLEIARALALDPMLLLLDEPAAGLNPSEIEEFIELVRHINKVMQIPIMLIEHRMNVIMELSDWIYVLNFGKMLAEGTCQQIQDNEEVTEAYIGGGDE